MADKNYINDSLNYLANKVNFYTYKKVSLEDRLVSGIPSVDGVNNNGGCYYEKIGNFVHVRISVSGFNSNIDTMKTIMSSIPEEIRPPHTIQAIMNGGTRRTKAIVWITGPNFSETSDQKRFKVYGCSEDKFAIGDLYYFV